MTRRDSRVLVTRLWLHSSKWWLFSDSAQKNFRLLWLYFDSKG